ncbi:MAG: UDP-N-acetylmuramoyl-L-alanine--D-glutamate ligase [Phycisphaerae bacterium]|nr:UDP-N-acetylmuramoyl-L-alanine--D-glutamate ligase [Phycisphaerae bacterium]
MSGLKLENSNVLIMGLGRFGGGIGAARFMVANGARVTVTDLASQKALQSSIEQLSHLDINWHLGGHLEADFINADIVIVNPAVKYDSPLLELAWENGAILTTEIDLFCQLCRNPIIAVTGSNGKSTTAAMIAAVLQQDHNVWLGGNIGHGSLLNEMPAIKSDHLIVLELSSFQLYWLGLNNFRPNVAVVTNISPNHLDWHGNMAHYIEAKQNIMRFQESTDAAVLCSEAPQLQQWKHLGNGQKIFYSATDIDIELGIPGYHNRLNAAAAWTVGKLLRVPENQIRNALLNYRSLPHRLQLIEEYDDIRYYNDSIATTPESTIAAIDSFDEHKILIMGGYDKQISMELLADKVADYAKAVVLIGQTADKIAKLLHDRKAKIPIVKAENMDQAVIMANKLAEPGDVVLLSPACASYGMFNNFTERGKAFTKAVQNLTNELYKKR